MNWGGGSTPQPPDNSNPAHYSAFESTLNSAIVSYRIGSAAAFKTFRIKVHCSPQSFILELLKDDLCLIICDDFNVRW